MPQGKAAHHKKLIICKEKPMPELSHIDPRSAALVDYRILPSFVAQ
jgi:hypothetical protein